MGELDRLNNSSQRCSYPNPQTCEDVNLRGKRNFTEVIKLRISKWEDYSAYLGEAHVISRVLLRGRQGDQNEQ